MNQLSKGSIIALVVALLAMGGVWWWASGAGGESGQAPGSSQDAPQTNESQDHQESTSLAPEAPSSNEQAGAPSGAADDDERRVEQSGEQSTAEQSGEQAGAGDSSEGDSSDPVADVAGGSPDPLGMRSDAEQAAREGGPDAGISGGQRAAAASYVLYAYGYSGSDPGEYYQGLNPYIDPTPFFASPGGAEVERYAASLSEANGSDDANNSASEGSQTDSAAELDGMRKLSDEPGGERWLLTMTIGERWEAEGGGPVGEVTSYEQEALLTRYSDSWRVAEAGAMREVSDEDGA